MADHTAGGEPDEALPPGRPDGTGSQTWSVCELSDAIGDRVRAAFPSDVWVRGEIHDLSRPASGHVYFSLVEDTDAGRARLSVMLRAKDKMRVNRLLRRAGGRVRMTDGTEVRIRGRLDFYAPRGQLQLRMASIDPAFTLGQLAVARAELVDRLRNEGLLDANRRLPLAMLPLRIGVVTSSGSAAEADLLDELDRSPYAFDVRVVDVRVQGIEAPGSVAAAITWLGDRDVDVVVVVRGGGATTDLAAFDHELVARAIANCPHPVVSGVGHETDRSVADEVAHHAAKTPTAAGQLLVGVVADAHRAAEEPFAAIVAGADRSVRRAGDELRRSAARASTAASAATRSELSRVDGLGHRVAVVAGAELGRAQTWTADSARRLRSSTRRALDDRDRHLDFLGARVSVADPGRAMARGWSITRRDDGTLVRSVDELVSGTTIHTTVADGTVASTITETDAEPTP